jgi:putative ABC transport system ATP-binding protein
VALTVAIRDPRERSVSGKPPAIEAVDLFRFYHSGDEETLALRGVSLAVEAGEMVAVVGPSGSGKSTLLACLAGLDDPDGGVVRVRGERLSRRSERAKSGIRAREIGILLQSGNLLEHLSVVDNVRLARRVAGSTLGDPMDLLEVVGVADRAHALPSQLSGGEAARAGLAVALAADPAVLLADEPTGEVDADNERDVRALLRARAARGTAVVVVTHSERVAADADRIVRLQDGVVQDG